MELSQPYGMSGSPPTEQPTRTSKVQKCHKAIVGLGKDDQLELKRLLVQAWHEHSLSPKDGEGVIQYIQRRG